jgi:sugar lactone lactonase YvrE
MPKLKTASADLLFSVKNALGEGPVWHPTENRLYWVDIVAGDLYRSDLALNNFTKTHFNTTIGAFGFRSDGGFILATGQGFSLWDNQQEKPHILWNPLPTRGDVRMNDGKVDPAGRFWAGSMDFNKQEGQLYRLDPDGRQHTLLHNIGISNGLGWSPDCKTMYYTDSFRSTIYAFDYDLASGAIHNQRPFVQLPDDSQEIVPDGLCVDIEGCIWSAQWNGGQVVRYDPQGRPILIVKVPTQHTTSCCFGDKDNSKLFITSARGELTPEQAAAQPLAGGVFSFQTQTQGLPTNFFG